MTKELVRVAKLQFMAGQAKPGPELAGLEIVMPEFTRQFNDATKDRMGEPVPVAISIYSDRSFTFKLFTTPTSFMLLKKLGVKSGSANAKTTFVGTIKTKDLEEIAQYKMIDLNAYDLKAAMAQVAGTARQMGILIEGYDDIKERIAKASEAKRVQHAAELLEKQLKSAAEEAALQTDKHIEAEVITEKDNEEEK